MSERINKIKTHFRENKTAYLALGGGITVGVIGTLVGVKRADLKISPSINQILSYKPEAKMEVYIEALGDPGNIIQDVATGTVYASQNQAARALGINPARISEQLNGRNPDAAGHVFKKLGKAPVAE